MQFTTLSSNLLLSITGAFLLLLPVPASASPDCSSSCGNVDTTNLVAARDALLYNIGCRDRGAGVMYNGGNTVAQTADGGAKAVFGTPGGVAIYLACSEVEDRIQSVITSCSSQGGGHELMGDRCAGVTACGDPLC